MLNNLLIYRLVIWNMIGAAIIAWAYMQGHLALLFTGDAAIFGAILIAVFLAGLASLFTRAWKVSKALNDVKTTYGGSPAFFTERAKNHQKFVIKNSHVGYTGVVLATIGLIGNLTGMVMAVHGFSSADAQASADRMAMGMEVAFNVTLISLSLALWIGVGYQMLRTATALLIVDSRHAG